jgi:hypothetical protein
MALYRKFRCFENLHFEALLDIRLFDLDVSPLLRYTILGFAVLDQRAHPLCWRWTMI